MKLEMFKDKKKEWRWHIKSKGRIVICSGEGYKRKASMLRSLRNVFSYIKVIY